MLAAVTGDAVGGEAPLVEDGRLGAFGGRAGVRSLGVPGRGECERLR